MESKFIIVGREEILGAFDTLKEAKLCIKATYRTYPNHTELNVYEKRK